MDLNLVMITGNVLRDPELRKTDAGVPVTNVGMAVNRRVPSGNGWRAKTVFTEVIFFGSNAEAVCAGGLRQGDRFFVEGELDQETRTVHKGKPNQREERKTKIFGQRFQFIPRGEHRGGKHEPAPVQP